MGEFININAMDEAIASYKQEQRVVAEKMLIVMAAKLYKEYKRYNPNGDYLSLCITKNSISINNAFWSKDFEYPINAFDDGEFRSLDVRELDEEEQEDVND